MNKVSQFSNFIKRQLPLLGTVEIETLLNSLPQAAIIVNNTNNHIQQVNTKATELTAYTRSEITQVDYLSLFQIIKEESSESNEQLEDVRSPSPCELIKRGGSTTVVQVRFNPLGENNRYSLITFELEQQLQLR